MNAVSTRLATAGFVRPTQGRVIGGVLAGIAERYRVDPWAARLVFIVAMLALPGSQFIVYPIAWLLMPDAQLTATPTTYGTTPPAATSTPQDTVIR